MNSVSVYNNRELSWLDFNERVLMQAADETVPLCERLKFLAIHSANLDEFFMIRVAGLKDLISAGYKEKDISGFSPSEALNKISIRVHKQDEKSASIFNALASELIKLKIFIFPLEPFDMEILDEIFDTEISPVITPVMISEIEKIPFIFNLKLCFFVELEIENKVYDALIILPENVKKVYKIKKSKKSYYFTPENIIERYIDKIFPGYAVKDYFLFRVTRNADLPIKHEDVEDLLSAIEENISARKWSNIVRVEINREISNVLTNKIKYYLRINGDYEDEDFYITNRPLNLSFLFNIKEESRGLYYKPFKPAIPDYLKNKSIFDIAKKKDILLFRPCNDFKIISKWIAEAGNDKNVLSIKMTLYRTDKNSKIVEALANAALKGKHVCAVVELKARFDEEKNVKWAKKLEEAGCIVTYGFSDKKIHAKIFLATRKEEGKIVRYAHISTGNYNEYTANIYTDIDYITAEEEACSEISNMFNYMTGYSDIFKWSRIKLAPVNLRRTLAELFDFEISEAKAGRRAEIIIKVNSVFDAEITDKIYAASSAGVLVKMIIRGICSIKPGIKDLSENIEVKSIIGRFLEHARIYYFYNAGNEKVFISTADLMTRNLDKRIELFFEIKDPESKKKLMDIIECNINDDLKSWLLKEDKYTFNTREDSKFNCQERICNKFCGEK
ncbi:MAG: polyphosphate kinase 1 [Candidatus Acidulodesulfobacterium acidiphilum]|uniref:Polyphosphate kinase n=1 Tax=Candidatus Acidulodesulfobacterium acidiphilum TaxID=2597224 RepID=A0A520X6U9_9DELT|nr:MAG: polyphosphate kinase 1 [Candidatus Acidulodesulfobacterium acidiphilum]